MTRPIVTAPPQTRFWLFYYASVSVAVVLLLVAAVVGIATDSAQNKEQDRLLDCFDTYAKDTATSSKAVRVSSSAFSAAQATEARASVKWTDLLVKALVFKGGDTSPEALKIVGDFIDASAQLKTAQAGLVTAQDDLAQARQDNPVPDPPSTFCEVQP